MKTVNYFFDLFTPEDNKTCRTYKNRMKTSEIKDNRFYQSTKTEEK